MTTLSSLGATLTVSGTQRTPLAAVITASLNPWAVTNDTLTADVSYNADLATAAYPGTAHQFVVGVKVTIDGAAVDPRYFLPGARITRGLGERATFTLPIITRATWPDPYLYPIGRPEGYLGPPPGGSTITIDGVYGTPSGPKTVRLLTDGVVVDCDEQFAENDTHTISGLGPGGRYEDGKVELNLPPGHGGTRAAVAGQIATLLGVTDRALSAPGRMDKPVQVVERNGMQLLADVLLPAGRVPHWDAAGTLVDPPRVVRSGPFDVVLDEADLMLAQGLSRQSATDGPTEITVEGEAQIVRDDCARVTTIRYVEAIAQYTRKEAAFQQQSGGALTALAPTQFSQLQVVSRVTTIEERECDRLISSRVITQEMHNPSAWRYEQDIDGAPKAYSTHYILDSDATQDDGALAYRYRVERFETVSDAVTTPTYDDDGFEVGAAVVTRGWGQRRLPIKEQGVTPAPWQEVDYVEDRKVLGNGEAVQDSVEVYFGPYHNVARNQATAWVPQVGGGTISVLGSVGTSRVTRSVDLEKITDGGGVVRGAHKRREVDEREEWAVRVGSGDYLYGDDTESRDSTESFRLMRIDSTDYIAEAGDGSHARLKRHRDGEGRRIPGERDTYESGLEGYLPSVERAPGVTPDAATYPDGKAASTDEAQPIECTRRVPVPPSIRLPKTERIHNPWIETEAEACRLAADEMSLRWAMRVTATVPVAFPLREGMRVLIRLRRAGLVLPVHVKTVEHDPWPQDLTALATTTFSGDMYVV